MSDKAQKSVVVAVERIYKHPVVGKYIKARSKFMAHDENDKFKVLLLPPACRRHASPPVAAYRCRMPKVAV